MSFPDCLKVTEGLFVTRDRVPTQIVFSNSLCFPCVFPVQSQIFPVPIYIICDYYIDETDLADLLGQKWKFSRQILQYPLLLESGNLQLEQTKFPVFSKFPGFFLTGIFLGRFPSFPCFPCALGTLRELH